MDPAALGAFFSGAAAVISAFISLRMTRKRVMAECKERIEEVKTAMREGIELGQR